MEQNLHLSCVIIGQYSNLYRQFSHVRVVQDTKLPAKRGKERGLPLHRSISRTAYVITDRHSMVLCRDDVAEREAQLC